LEGEIANQTFKNSFSLFSESSQDKTSWHHLKNPPTLIAHFSSLSFNMLITQQLFLKSGYSSNNSIAVMLLINLKICEAEYF